MINTLIFDIDTTLLDFFTMKTKAVRSAVNAMINAGMDIEHNVAYNEIFKIYDKLGYEYQEVFDKFIIQELGYLDYKILASAIVHYKREKEANLALYPNTYETLVELSKMRLQLGILSDAPKREAWVRLCSLNLHHIFDNVVTFDDTGYRKPHPEPFKKICRLLKSNPLNCLMVGDWPERDIAGAKSLGMITAFAKYGSNEENISSGADYELDDIGDLLKIVREINCI